MKNGIRLVFLACTLAIACVATNVAQPQTVTLQPPPERPWSVKVFLTESGGIAVHNGSPNSHDQTKVWARTGGMATFVIENHDGVAHDVRIPIGEFDPSVKEDHKGDATPEPLVASGIDRVNV